MYYNLEKTASTLGLSTGDVNRLREKGELRAYRDGANWKFRKEDVDKYLAKMIKERSSDALLSTESDDDQTIAATDSSAFDKMFEEGENYIKLQGESDGFNDSTSSDPADLALAPADDDLVLAPEGSAADGLSLAKDDDDLVLAPEGSAADGLSLAKDDDDLVLAPEESAADGLSLAKDDDDLVLAPEESAADGLSLAKEEEGGLSLTKKGESDGLMGEDSALADDLALAPEGSEGGISKVDLTADAPTTGSDSDLLHLGGDSGLSLMDDLGGSNVDLADGDDLVLGGSGSSSGSGLNLSGGSGLSLLGDSDADFDIDGAVEESEAPKSDEDDGLFELAPDPNSVLNLVKDADEDAPTELAATDESIFDLADESSVAAATETESETASLFTIDDESQEGTGTDGLFSGSNDASVSRTSDEEDNLFSLSDDEGSAGSSVAESAVDSVSSDIDLDGDPFAASDSSQTNGPVTTSSPFESGSDMFAPAPSEPVGEGFDFAAGGDVGFTPTTELPSHYEEAAPSTSPSGVSSTNFTGKDLIFLVPCLIFLILATIGALELCRTIWSYQEGIGDVGGPLLEMIAKMVNLM